jgi:hypothetical protein
MWVKGTSQAQIGAHFGYDPHVGTGLAKVNAAIRHFIESDCATAIGKAQGEDRKRMARSALRRFRHARQFATPVTAKETAE